MTYLLFVDGDRVGAPIEGALASGDLAHVARLSELVGRATLDVVQLIEARGGTAIFVGGDNVLAHVVATDALVVEVLDCYARLTQMSASAGVGTTSNEGYLALQIAISRGGGQVCWWDRLTAPDQACRADATQANSTRPRQ